MERLDTLGSNFPPQLGNVPLSSTDNGQIPVSCLGRDVEAAESDLVDI